MQWLMFLALSAIAAILYGPVLTWLQGQSTKAATTSDSASQFFSSYFGKTAVTTAAFFVVLLVSATVLSFLGGSKAAKIPEVV